MISAAQWKAYNDAVACITDTARATVAAKVGEWLEENPGASTAEARDAAERILKSYSGVYSQQAATLAAEWYDAQGKAAGAKLDRAVTSATVDEDSLRRTVHYQARLLESGEGDFAAAVGEWAENAAKRAVNGTVLANAKRDRRKGVRFARVTSGRNTCGFCLMLAGRGAVYHTRETAGEFNRYHRHCSCKIVPSYSGDQYEVLVEGYDPRKIQDRLIEIENLTGTVRNTAAFEREVRLRDPEWLYGGESAAPCYLDGEVEKKKLADKDHPAELRTASRLSAKGFSTVFVDDELRETVAGNSWSTVVGLPDLESGVEIKNVSSARSENTISSHIGRAKKKRGLTALVIDVSENPNLSDTEARSMIARSLKRHSVRSAYMVDHSGEVVLVRAN